MTCKTKARFCAGGVCEVNSYGQPWRCFFFGGGSQLGFGDGPQGGQLEAGEMVGFRKRAEERKKRRA